MDRLVALKFRCHCLIIVPSVETLFSVCVCFKSLARASEAMHVLFLRALPDAQKVIAPFNSTINASCQLPAAESFSVCRIIVLCMVKTSRASNRLL